MKILSVVFASISLFGFAIAPLTADVPSEIKPTIDPQLEALTAAELVRLIKDMSTEEARNQLSAQLIDPEQEIDQIVMGLGALGRTEVALKYDALAMQAQLEMGAGVSPPPFAVNEELPPVINRTESANQIWIYQAAIYRKVAYGKRSEGRVLVTKIKTPSERLVPLLWLAASALRDNQRAEALADLKHAIKWGGDKAAQHEWLGLLLYRAGDTTTAMQLFNRRQKALEARKVEEAKNPQSGERFGQGWGSLCTALLRAGRKEQGLALLKKHPKAYSTVLYSFAFAKDSPARREILDAVAKLPTVLQQVEDIQLLALLPIGEGQVAKVAQGRIELLERETLARIGRWKQQRSDPYGEYNDPSLALYGKVVAGWQWIGQPGRGKAFLKRPDLKLNDSQRALIDSSALLTSIAYQAFLNGQRARPKVDQKLSLSQSQLLCHQLASNFRHLSFDEVKGAEFSDVVRRGLNLFQSVGDKSSATALVKASEAAIQRNWRFSNRMQADFLSQFAEQAGYFAKIGDMDSTKKWMDNYRRQTPKFSNEVWIGTYQSAGMMREARATVDAMPKPVARPANDDTPYSEPYWNIMSARSFAFTEAFAAQTARTAEARAAALEFPEWAAKLPIEARVLLLPQYAQSLSDLRTYPTFNIRDSGYWGMGD